MYRFLSIDRSFDGIISANDPILRATVVFRRRRVPNGKFRNVGSRRRRDHDVVTTGERTSELLEEWTRGYCRAINISPGSIVSRGVTSRDS